MSHVCSDTPAPETAGAVSEVELEPVRDLYGKCFQEVLSEIVVASEPFSEGAFRFRVAERFDCRLKLEQKLDVWFTESYKALFMN